MPTIAERRHRLAQQTYSATEFLRDVRFAGEGQVRAKLSEFRAAAGSDEHSTFSDPHGGFLLPTGLAPDLFGVPSDIDHFAGKTVLIEMEQPEVGVPAWTHEDHSTSLSGGLRSYRTAESHEVPSSRMELKTNKLRSLDLFSLILATNELVEQTPRAFTTMLSKAVENHVGGELYAEKLTGNGVNEFTGALHSPSTIDVAKESGQTAGTIVGENVVKMKARAFCYNECEWIACNDTVEQLESATVTDAAGNSKFLLQGDMLAGRPISFTEFLPTVGSRGDLLLVNPTQFVTGIYKPLSYASSVHCRFIYHESAYLFWVSGDFQPLWNVPLTPRNGSATLSPSVVLEARE